MYLYKQRIAAGGNLKQSETLRVDEKILIDKCLKGDRDSQRILFERYCGKMLALCSRYSRHKLEAEDICQEGFIKVYKKLHQYEHRGSLEQWIRRIMINTAIKYLKKGSVKNEQIGLEDYPEGVVNADAVSLLSEKELIGLISKLPDGYRLVFNMYAIEGMSHKEISEVLGIGESTSRSQLVKARKWLQEKIIEQQKVYL
jgi:RNA polymerase sigma factor (sigma-70 family)